MIYLFNKKLQNDEIAILEELLRIIESKDEYDYTRSYKCGSVCGVATEFLKKRGIRSTEYNVSMISFLQTLVHTDTLDFILADYTWKDFFDRPSLQEAKNRIKYFIEYGIPYRLFFFNSRSAKAWYKTNEYIQKIYS